MGDEVDEGFARLGGERGEGAELFGGDAAVADQGEQFYLFLWVPKTYATRRYS
jgi:hypothetical protein